MLGFLNRREQLRLSGQMLWAGVIEPFGRNAGILFAGYLVGRLLGYLFTTYILGQP